MEESTQNQPKYNLFWPSSKSFYNVWQWRMRKLDADNSAFTELEWKYCKNYKSTYTNQWKRMEEDVGMRLGQWYSLLIGGAFGTLIVRKALKGGFSTKKLRLAKRAENMELEKVINRMETDKRFRIQNEGRIFYYPKLKQKKVGVFKKVSEIERIPIDLEKAYFWDLCRAKYHSYTTRDVQDKSWMYGGDTMNQKQNKYIEKEETDYQILGKNAQLNVSKHSFALEDEVLNKAIQTATLENIPLSKTIPIPFKYVTTVFGLILACCTGYGMYLSDQKQKKDWAEWKKNRFEVGKGESLTFEHFKSLSLKEVFPAWSSDGENESDALSLRELGKKINSEDESEVDHMKAWKRENDDLISSINKDDDEDTGKKK